MNDANSNILAGVDSEDLCKELNRRGLNYIVVGNENLGDGKHKLYIKNNYTDEGVDTLILTFLEQMFQIKLLNGILGCGSD